MRLIQECGLLLPIAVLALACDATSSVSPQAAGDLVTLDVPVRSYVIARWDNVIPAAEDAGECPDGLNRTEAEVFPEQWEAWLAERRRLRDIGGYLPWDDERLPPDACRDNPLAQPDPGFVTLDGPATVAGLDLDGTVSTRTEAAAAACAHDDFTGPGGEAGIDNQMWRLMGCIRGYRPNDLMDRLQQSNASVKEGGYAILMEIAGVDDPRNDDAVEVRFLSANHGVDTNAVGGIMQDVSYTAHPEERFHNPPASGRIVDGVLTTDPVDLYLKVKQQTMDNTFWFRDARVRAEVHADGRITGVLGAYHDVDNFFYTLNEHWIGDHHQGRNAAFNRGFMCAGIYHAMFRVADGHPEPETGQCTSISTALQFEAVPAFVIRQQVAMGD